VWGIGERKWEGDFRRRVMFENMIERVLMYGERSGDRRNKRK
jgi:hypothetical protein